MKRRDYLNSIGKVIDGNIKYTDTTKFLLPMLGYTLEHFDGNLINSYVDMDNQELILVFENDDNKVYQNLARCRINKSYIKDYTDDDELIITFSIPNIIVYKQFLRGEYSGFDEQYKQKLLAVHGHHVIKDKTKKVSMCDTLYPRIEKRQAIADILGVDRGMIKEVYDSPNLDYERFITREQLKVTILDIHE